MLELGCGTGLFSRHLLARYPEGRFVLTDARAGHDRRNAGAISRPLISARISFEMMDAAPGGRRCRFDLIVSSMTLHWLADPVASARRACAGCSRPAASCSTPRSRPRASPNGARCWRAKGLPSGLAEIPGFPASSRRSASSPDRRHALFLRRMKAVGGLTPREGYAPLSPARCAAPSAPPTGSTAAASPGTSSMGGSAPGEPVEAFDEPGIGAGELVIGDAIRRHQIERRAERPDVEARARGTRPSAPGSPPIDSRPPPSRRRRGSSRAGAAASRRVAPQARRA